MEILMIVARYKSPSHDTFHLLPSTNGPFNSHKLIPSNTSIIGEFNNNQFNLFLLKIIMAIKHMFNLSLPLQIQFRIIFTLKCRDCHLNAPQMIISSWFASLPSSMTSCIWILLIFFFRSWLSTTSRLEWRLQTIQSQI